MFRKNRIIMGLCAGVFLVTLVGATEASGQNTAADCKTARSNIKTTLDTVLAALKPKYDAAKGNTAALTQVNAVECA